jgi:hypothetical protein
VCRKLPYECQNFTEGEEEWGEISLHPDQPRPHATGCRELLFRIREFLECPIHPR